MNQILPARIIALAILACAFPIAVQAELSANTILSAGNIPATVYGAGLHLELFSPSANDPSQATGGR